MSRVRTRFYKGVFSTVWWEGIWREIGIEIAAEFVPAPILK